MRSSVFIELHFWLLLALSVFVPSAIYFGLLVRRAVLPVLFGGIGVNLISHVLIRHLTDAEQQFDAQHHND